MGLDTDGYMTIANKKRNITPHLKMLDSDWWTAGEPCTCHTPLRLCSPASLSFQVGRDYDEHPTRQNDSNILNCRCIWTFKYGYGCSVLLANLLVSYFFYSDA